MGDNQLSILIQAKINEASLDTMDKQLQTLAKNLKAVKISLDLGDVKAQFAKMFQEIEKESQKQKISSGVKVLNPSNQTFSGNYDEALRKAVVHVNALENHFERVGEIVKGLGNLKDLKEEFASADGTFVSMKAKVEKVDGTLKQIKDVEVFKTLNAETNEFVYTVGNATVQTKEFGYTVKQLQSASKNSGLYESMQKYNEGVIDAKQYTEELQKAIYRYGNESKGTKKFFGEMDEGIQKFYLEELAKAQEKVNQQLEEEKKLYEEIGRKREELQYKRKVESREDEQKQLEYIAKALEEEKKLQEELRKKKEATLAMEERIDQARKASVSNNSNAKSQYGGFIDESALRKIQLGFNELSVDTKEYTTDLKAVEAQIKALEKAYAKVEQEAKIAMEMDAQKRANNYAKEQENILNEQIKIEEDISKRRINLIDFEIEKQQEKARIFSQLLQAQMQGAVQAEQAEKKQEEQTNKTNKELTDRDTLCKRIQSQMSKLGSLDLVSSSEIAETQRLTKEYRELMTAIEKGSISLDVARSKFNNLGAQMRIFQQSTQTTTNTTRSLFDTFKTLVGVSSVFDVINLGKQAIRSMVSEVKTLDSALVELNKVSDLSDAQLNAYVKTAFKVSETVGRLGSDVINATSDFVQMGYSLEESAKLAENALMYVNVGDLSSVDEATSAMISAMKAFGIEANNSLDIVDKINNMSNNFAIDAKGIGEGLKRASSALASANNSIDETLALMSVGNQVIQDPDTLANGLKTISMRMRGLSEDGSELESKLEDVLATYTKGVKVLNDDGSFRSTFAILNDLGKEWDKLSDKSQAYLAETIAGKDRANIFLSLMQNAEDLEKALETSKNSANSAVEENERYMNSIEGKLSQMQTAWQSLASTTINSELVKGIVDMTTGLIKLTETCGGLVPVIIGLATAFALLKLAPVVNMIGNLTLSIMNSIPIFASATGAVMAFNTALTFGVGGAIVASIMAIGAGIKYVSTMSERAEERVTELKNSISELGSEKETVQELADTYDDLKDRVMPTIEEQEKLASTMNELKTLVPNLNGYYKENGDFVITSTEALNDYIEAKKEEIQLEREKLALEAEGQMGGISEKIEEQIELNAEAERYLELLKKQSDGTLTGDESDDLERLGVVWLEAKYAQKQIEDGTKAISESLVEYREKLTDIMVASEDWMGLTEEQRNAIKELVAESDYSFLAGIYDDATNDVQDYILKLLELDRTQKIIAKNAEDGSEKLRKYAYSAKDAESTKKAFEKITKEIGDLNSVLDDLNKGNGITASSVKKIIETYPELLKHIHNEASLREAITQTMDEQKNAQQKAYNDMLSASDDYYKNVMLANEEWKKTTEANVEALFESLGIAYEIDLENYTNMEKAKASVTQDLINSLGTSWEQFFDSVSGQFKKMDFDSVFSDFTSKMNPIEKQIFTGNAWTQYSREQAYNNLQSGAEAYWTAERDKFLKAKEELESKFVYHFEPIKIELGGSTKSASRKNSSRSKPKASYIASIYQAMVDDILKGSDDVEREIEKANAKIENALLRGNIDGKPDNYKELAKELKELSELGNVDLTIRPQIDSSKMQSAGWDVEDGSIATTFTQGEFIWQGDEENGSYKYIHYTPILPNGKVLTPDELSNYLSNTLESSEDILKADKLGIVIKVDDVDLPEKDIKNLFNGYDISSEMKNFLSQAGEWDDYIHQVQERFYKTKADSQEKLADMVIELITQQRDNTAKMAKEIDALLSKMSKDLADTGLFKGYDLANLTEKQLAEVKQKLEKQINSATLQENDKEVERLKLAKSLVEDVGSVYLSTLEKRKDLSQEWWDLENERIEKVKERIDDLYDKSKKRIDESNRDIELQQILLKEGTKEYIDCEKQKYNNLLALQEEARQALIKIKEHDKNLESKQAQEYLKIWYDTEKAKREKLISINKQIQDARKADLEKQMTAMKEYKDAMEKIIDATVKLIKQEQEAKKKALKDELDKYKSIINAKKEALKKEKDDKDYRTELSEKQAQITKVENKILELQNDNSLSAKKKRQELEEELLKLKKELTDTQEKHALDSALDTLDKEYEAFEKTQNDKIDAIDDYLDKEGKLRQDAIKRIENDQGKLYKELLEWNKKYGTAIDSDITNAWDKAMKGMKEYGNGQNKVLTTIENIVEKLKEANEEIKLMKENSGVISGEDIADGNLYDSPNTNSGSQPTNKPQGEAYQKLIDEIAPQMNRNSDAWKDATSEEERKRLAQENERLAKKIGAWKKADGLWYVTKKGYDKPVALKELYPNYHTGGIVGGEAEAGLKSTEQFAKLLKGEVVSTESQMRQFLNVTYPKMLGITQGNSVGGITIDRFVDITVQGNLDTSVDLENIIKRASQKAIDSLVNTMSNMGIRGRII